MDVTLIGGALGAGKTTLLTNLLKNDSFSTKSGIVVMDAAGTIDYDRLKTIAESKGVAIENATSACTVCDGPESAFTQIKKLKEQGVEDIVVELSGQLPLSIMKNKLNKKNLENISQIKTMYVVDSSVFNLVQAADEVPFAQVVGFTKNGLIDVSNYNPNANVFSLNLDDDKKLSDLFFGAPKTNERMAFFIDHQHSKNPNLTTKFSSKIANPYHDIAFFENLFSGINAERAKGYVALNAFEAYSFDKVFGEYSGKVIEDPALGNGLILVANNKKMFEKSRLESHLEPVLVKPEFPLVLRRGSSKNSFEQYIGQALKAGLYDEALGASEQYNFEQEDVSLFQEVLPEFVKGKWQDLNKDSNSRPQRVLQGMSLLYHLSKNKEVNITIFNEAREQYLSDLQSMNEVDWEYVKMGANGAENLKYINLVKAKIEKN